LLKSKVLSFSGNSQRILQLRLIGADYLFSSPISCESAWKHDYQLSFADIPKPFGQQKIDLPKEAL
jgi:hypothetical protein